MAKTLHEPNVRIKPPAPPKREFPDNFSSMSPDEKYQFFVKDWMSTENKPFESEEVAQRYRRRAQRWVDVVALKEPDRIPIFTMSEGFIVNQTGISYRDTFYDNEKTCNAVIEFYKDLQPDYLEWVPGGAGSAFDMLEYQALRWPGSPLPGGLADDTHFQYIEDEFMSADEYDQLIANPEGYFLRTFIPRAWKGLAGLAELPSFFYMFAGIASPLLFTSLAVGPVNEAITKLLEAAGKVADNMMLRMMTGMEITKRFGTPNLLGSFTSAPFDLIGDTLRGTKGMMFDLYRRPEKVIKACEAVTPIAIDMAVKPAVMSGAPFVLNPLHKGADSFMSREQFARFYWPSYKAMLEGIIDAGLVPIVFVEGAYNQRLDIIAESGLPAGKTVWLFDKTDIQEAKEKFGGFACIGGNVPSSLFATGTPQEMEAHCRNLIDTVGQGGGFFLAPGAVINDAKPENMRAFLNSVKK
jgi:uroporphyrinogen-III decarboxylase